MQQRSPVHFGLEFLGDERAICAAHGAKVRAPRHIRQAPTRSSSSPPHACPRTPAGQSDRCPYARCSGSGAGSCVASAALSCPAFPAFPGAISADIPHVCADLPGSPDGALTAQKSSSKACAGGNIPPPQNGPIPGRVMRRPARVVGLVPGTLRHRRKSLNSKERHMLRDCTTRKMCRIRTVTEGGGGQRGWWGTAR